MSLLCSGSTSPQSYVKKAIVWRVAVITILKKQTWGVQNWWYCGRDQKLEPSLVAAGECLRAGVIAQK
jgi:hypothetical protein